jgi:CRP/FNR family transcriptional regulator, anaerobic regulatory protein
MFEKITLQLTELLGLSPQELGIFLSKLQVKTFKRRELIVREGQVCKYAYFINSGCLRYFYVVNDQENTGQFFFEHSWYTDYASFISGQPTTQNIQCIEQCELLLLSRFDLQQLFIEVPKFEKFGRIMAENAYLGLRGRNEILTNQTAEERYLRLLKERPKVMERVPQHYIASYLGIRPQSLSRIRKRILDNQ